jgi:hypothetical protein
MWTGCLSVFLVGVPCLKAQQVSLDGEQVTIVAKGARLTDVLMLFAHHGVEINIDPEIDSRVSDDLVDLPVDQALKSLLQDYGHVTSWEVIKGPVGDLPKLAGIDVYRKGYAHTIRPLLVHAKGIKVVRNPEGTDYAQDELLIGVKAGTTLAQFKHIIGSVGGVVQGSISSRGVYRIKLPPGSHVPSVVVRLAEHPEVAAVEPNYILEEPGPTPVDQARADSGTATSGNSGGVVRAPGVREGASTVAVLDTGLSSSIDMGDLIKGAHDALNPGAEVGDSTGHGTQMAMVASGMVPPTGTTSAGENGGIPVLAIKSFDDQGITTNYGLMESIQYAMNNDARVLSLSWGSEQSSAFMQDSIVAAQEGGMIVVAAVGNEATGTASYPAAYDGVIGVGALDANGELWENSNYGSFVDLVAPGHAAFPIGHEGPPGAYIGTSISTAYVAGYLSRLINENPGAGEQEILDKMYGATVDGGATGHDTKFGAGKLVP